MNIFWLIIIGVFSGIVAGMGMGGGTLLIPMLTIFFNVEQQVAQGANLLVFVPLGIVASIIYIKSGLVNFKYFLLVVIPAVSVALLGALVSTNINQAALRFIFAIFVLGLGVLQLVLWVVKKIKKPNT